MSSPFLWVSLRELAFSRFWRGSFLADSVLVSHCLHGCADDGKLIH